MDSAQLRRITELVVTEGIPEELQGLTFELINAYQAVQRDRQYMALAVSHLEKIEGHAKAIAGVLSVERGGV